MGNTFSDIKVLYKINNSAFVAIADFKDFTFFINMSRAFIPQCDGETLI